jgi:hypothetical protein
MKKLALTLALVGIGISAYPQGQINFQNLIGGSAASSIRAPIFGPEPTDPTLAITGQGTNNNSFPPGTTRYTGALLAGTGFTAELWAGPAGAAESALTPVANATATFKTGAANGYFTGPTTAPTINGVDVNQVATLQVRAWDNKGGTLTSWAAVLADPTALRGVSPLFSATLGGGAVTPPNMTGLVSFNIFAVPEPSVIAIGALGLGALLLRRRK